MDVRFARSGVMEKRKNKQDLEHLLTETWRNIHRADIGLQER